jgi:hypothetical protein
MRGREVKKLLTNPILYAATALALPVCSMEAISEREMSEVSGQAFIQVDASTNGSMEFSRISLGMVVETLLTADLLSLGEFDRTADDDRTGDGTVRMADTLGTATSGGRYDMNNNGVYDADVIIENFGLGRVDNYQNADLASVVPFLIENPYVELAYNTASGTKEMAGVRIGFEKSKGDLSGDLISLTGRIEGRINGEGVDAEVIGLQIPVTFRTSFELVDGTTADGSRNLGEGAGAFANASYLKRASWLGVADGTEITVRALGLLNLNINIEECVSSLGGLGTCFASNTYQSIYIGDESITDSVGDASAQLEQGGAEGFFISLQSENVAWQDLSSSDPSARVLTEKGAYLNISGYNNAQGQREFPINLTLQEAERGKPRVATCVGQLKGC